MSTLILDASVAVAWLLEDEFDRLAGATLDLVRQDGAVVPQLWHYEVRNALLVAQRRGRLPEGGPAARLTSLGRLPIQTDQDADLEAAMELAIAHRLSFYDSVYVELARRRRASLATVDAGLARAVRAEGLEVVG